MTGCVLPHGLRGPWTTRGGVPCQTVEVTWDQFPLHATGQGRHGQQGGKLEKLTRPRTAPVPSGLDERMPQGRAIYHNGHENMLVWLHDAHPASAREGRPLERRSSRTEREDRTRQTWGEGQVGHFSSPPVVLAISTVPVLRVRPPKSPWTRWGQAARCEVPPTRTRVGFIKMARASPARNLRTRCDGLPCIISYGVFLGPTHERAVPRRPPVQASAAVFVSLDPVPPGRLGSHLSTSASPAAAGSRKLTICSDIGHTRDYPCREWERFLRRLGRHKLTPPMQVGLPKGTGAKMGARGFPKLRDPIPIIPHMTTDRGEPDCRVPSSLLAHPDDRSFGPGLQGTRYQSVACSGPRYAKILASKAVGPFG